jgi:hypothetical protein
MKAMLLLVLVFVSGLVWGEPPCSDKEEAQETLCSQAASALRVQLHALELLRKNSQADNHEVIHYLELQSEAKKKLLSEFASQRACQTQNVERVVAEFDEYRRIHGKE